jgi:peroxiredoxin
VFTTISCSAQKKDKENTTTTSAVAEKTDLPNLVMTLPDGKKQSAQQLKGKVILILFQPDCDHCQREAWQIQENIKAFAAYELYFISSSSFDQIKQFASEYKLNNHSNVHFATTTVDNVISSFGPIAAPSLYIYAETGKLIQSFNGEVAIEVVKKYL